MIAVVPAAGEGRRLHPLTAERPKGLVEVADKPLLAHVFETAIDAGVTEIVVIIGEQGKMIREEFGRSFDSIPLSYVRQPEPRGLGDAILWASEYIDGAFAVFNGDNVFLQSPHDALTRIDDPSVDAVLVVESRSKEEARNTGNVTVVDGEVTRIVEKPDNPTSAIVTTGCYVLPPAILHALRLARPSESGEIELSEAVDLLITAGYRIEIFEFQGDRVNVNTPEDVKTAELLLEEKS